MSTVDVHFDPCESPFSFSDQPLPLLLQVGRFGLGFSSVYHLTDVPSFVTNDDIVWLDPHATFVPKVDPRNPGKRLKFTSIKGKALLAQCPDQFEPLRAWDCTLDGTYNGK
jgi:sacsin